MKLSPNEICFEPASYADPNGRLFYWAGDVYRGVSSSVASGYRELLESKRLARLFDLGLIETEIAPITVDGFDLVLKHRRVPFVSYAPEWCGAMLKTAALFVLDLSVELAQQGLELQDANPWNVLFDGCTPKYVDFGSIVPITTTRDWQPKAEFIKCFLNPLVLMAHHHGSKARALMVDHKRWGATDQDMASILSRRQKLRRFVQNAGHRVFPARRRLAVIAQLRAQVEAINFEDKKSTWSNYYDGFVSLESKTDWTPKQLHAFEILEKTKPKTVLDIGCNTGWYSRLAARFGCQVVAFDVDEMCVQRLFLASHAENEKILPLFLDFCNPTPRYGSPKLEFSGATERLQCEMTIALAVVHHLVFKQGMTFDDIVDKLTQFTGKYLVVEFIPRDDRYVAEWYTEKFSWYTYENFVTALKKHFQNVSCFPSNRPPRVLLFCEK